MDFFTGIWSIYKTINHINIAKAGLIVGIAGCIGEFLQPYFGHLCDRGYRKNILILGLSLTSLIFFLPLCTHLLYAFFILLFINLGSSAFHPAAAGMVPTLVTTNKARALLFFNSGGSVGFGLSQILFCALFYALEGFFSLLVIIPFCYMLFLVFHHFPNQDQNFSSSPISFKERLILMLRHRKILVLLYFSQVMYQGMRSAFLFFFPEIIRERVSHAWLWQGGGFLFFVLGTALSMVPAGHLCDRFGAKKVLLVAVTGTILMFYTLVFSKNLSVVEILVLLTSLGALFGIINPLTVAWGHSLIPESPSTISGLLMGMAWCIGNLGPAFAGPLYANFKHNADHYLLMILGTLLVFVFFLLLAAPAAKKDVAHQN